MKYTVVCVGKLKKRFWKDACAEYTKRLGAYAKVDMREVADIDPAKAGGVDAARDKEGAAILAALPSRAHVILLAIEGKERSSEELSARLDDLMLRGSSDIAFVIGGSDGVSKSTAPARLAVASRITSRSAIRNNPVGQWLSFLRNASERTV